MKRILIIGETPLVFTRFGTTIREIGNILHNSEYEVACMGFNYTGWPFLNDKIRYPLYPWLGSPDDPAMITRALSEFKPDTLLLIGNSFFFQWLKKIETRDRYRIILHTTFKSFPIDKDTKELLKLVNVAVVNSSRELDKLKLELPDIHAYSIAPGIDTKNLKPLGSDFSDGRFRVGCVAQDIPQMDIPTLLKAFGIVAGKEARITFGVFADAAQLHTWNIPDMIDVYALQDRCSIVNPQPEINFSFPSMSALYATMDVFIGLHQEECVNISAIEAGYCGVPMILPRCGSTGEFLPEDVIFLDNEDIFVAPPNNTRYRVFDALEIASKIIQCFHDNPVKKDTSKNRLELNRLDWTIVGNDWLKLLL